MGQPGFHYLGLLLIVSHCHQTVCVNSPHKVHEVLNLTSSQKQKLYACFLLRSWGPCKCSMDVSKLVYRSWKIDWLSDSVIVCFIARCFRDSGGGKDVLPFASDL